MTLAAPVLDAVNTPDTIPPLVVRTSNVAKELMQVAANHKVSVHTLDFRLLDTQTFSRISQENAADIDDWVELSHDEMADITEDLFLNPHYELKQIYEIEIFTVTDAPKFERLDISIAGNATLCKIFLTIKAGSEVAYGEDFEKDFFELVKKKKLRANLMIGLFEESLKKNLSELIAKIRVHGTYRFEEQERYTVAEGLEPVATVDDKLILHYDAQRQKMDEAGRMDYAKRGYIISVVANELLIEYIKPRKGESGRNCRGEFIVPKEPIVKNEPTFNITENISQTDTDKSIEYRAKVGGYVTFEGGVYDIKTEMDVTEISFRSTGSIETQLDADVSINVKEKDALKDAIGMGMEVTVNVINIDGNVGPDAKITAHKATIEGQVHNSATIKADELTINIHKGTAIGKEVHITRLEHGTVEADKVTITQAVGGKVRAKEIYIELLGSHTKLTASHKIEIKKLQGGENILTIDPLLNESREFLDESEVQMAEAKKAMHDVEKELEEHEKTMKENEASYEDIKRKLMHYKKNGIKIPAAYVQKYQQFQHFRQKLESLRKEYQEKVDHHAFIGARHTALQSEITEARIINHDRWHNYNEIIFKLIDPPIDVTYFPADGSEETILGLHQDEEGEFSIKALSK